MTTQIPNAAVPDRYPKAVTVKSAARVLEIFEFFDSVRRACTVGEVSRALNYPQSSTSILLRGLADLGYLVFQQEGRSFVPSLRLGAVGQWVGDYIAPHGGLAQMIKELSRETGHTIIIGARCGLESQYVHVIEATNAIRLHVAAGTRRVFVWSAVGFVLMAPMCDDEIRALVRRTNAHMMGGRPQIDVEATLARVESVRRNGYVYSRGLVTPAAGMICVPLPTLAPANTRALAVAVAASVEQLDQTEAELVHRLRAAVFRNLGGQIETRPITSVI